jgi:hypothetical protein
MVVHAAAYVRCHADEGLSVELGQAERAACGGKRVVRREEDGQFVPPDPVRDQAGTGLEIVRRPQDADVQLAVEQGLELLRSRHVPEFDPDLGVAVPEGTHQPREHVEHRH